LRIRQAEFLRFGTRTFDELLEINFIIENVTAERARFLQRFEPVTRKTKLKMLTNQLNYIDMVINMNLVQLCAEDDFIYEKPQCTYMNRLETETNV
jgi:hypothetical protein